MTIGHQLWEGNLEGDKIPTKIGSGRVGTGRDGSGWPIPTIPMRRDNLLIPIPIYPAQWSLLDIVNDLILKPLVLGYTVKDQFYINKG